MTVADSTADRTWPGTRARRGLGVALLGLAGAGRFASGEPQVVVRPGGELPAEPAVDVALGALDLVLEAGGRVVGTVRRRVDPVLRVALAPAATPLAETSGVGRRLLGGMTRPLAERGRRLRRDSEHEAAAAVAATMPQAVDLIMGQVDLTELAIDNVDISRVLEAAVAQVDLTSFAVQHMDLARLIEVSLDSVDFTGLAIDKLDFARTVAAALEQVDVVAIARDQLDPVRVAAYLRDNVDLAEAIRSAPGTVAGEAFRGVRQGVQRIVPNRGT